MKRCEQFSSNNESEKEINNISVKDIYQDIQSVKGDMWEIYRSESEKRIEMEKAFLNKYIKDLLENKEKYNFKFIFKTEKGSIYFVSENGESLRFKKEEDGDIEMKSIFKKIIFISIETVNSFLDLMRKDGLEDDIINYEIKKEEINRGFHPLEIGLDGYPNVYFEENEDVIKIIGTGDKAEEMISSFASGIHIGHKISEVYWPNFLSK